VVYHGEVASARQFASLYPQPEHFDNAYQVKGVQGLRVVDASIMPEIISGNTVHHIRTHTDIHTYTTLQQHLPLHTCL
jgi:hypothetical protein